MALRGPSRAQFRAQFEAANFDGFAVGRTTRSCAAFTSLLGPGPILGANQPFRRCGDVFLNPGKPTAFVRQLARDVGGSSIGRVLCSLNAWKQSRTPASG